MAGISTSHNMLVMSVPMGPATRRSGSGQTHRDSTSLKRSLSIAKTLSRSKMACKMEATNSMRGNHNNMPLKYNMMIKKLISMSCSKSEDQMVDKTSMHKNIREWTPILEKDKIAAYNSRIQGDIKAKRRCTTVVAEEKSKREHHSTRHHNIRSSKTRARVIWVMRMTWMKVLLWLKGRPWRRGAIRKCNRRDSPMAGSRSIKRPHSSKIGREHVRSSLCMTLNHSKLVTEQIKLFKFLEVAQMCKLRELQIIHRRSSKTHIKKLQHMYFIRSGMES